MVKLSSPPDFNRATLADIMGFATSDALPPVDVWHPQNCGEIDIRIQADGRWYHEGSEIRRPAMVRLFSRVLRREADGSHVLVTPAEKLTIEVEDAPFVAVELRAEEGRLIFRLNTEDVIITGADNPLRLRDGPAGWLPYLHVRGTADRPLEARLARPVYYALAALADANGCVTSGNASFKIGDMS